MKITVDWDRCEGHGLCEEQAPDAFSLDDDGMLTYHYDGRDVPVEHEAATAAAAAACPVAALRAT